MSWDLAISPHGDLIFAANRDLAGVSGIDLIDQRIRTRLRLHRGTWIYDTDGTLGSNLYRLIGSDPDTAAQAAPAYVREALRDMNEISIDDVNVEITNRDITISVIYRLVTTAGDLAGTGGTEEQFSISVTLDNDTFGRVE